MDKRILALDGVNFVGMLLVVLGLVQCVAAPLFTMENTLKQLYPENKNEVLYMVLATGVAVAFAGTLLMSASKDMRRMQWWAWRLGWRVTWFLVILGVGAMVAMWQNPFSEILIVLDVILLLLLSKAKEILRPDPNKEWPK
ncbi:MAG TPA: hypothetical protein VGL38_05820 [bacterium]|jgi:hypothetical protein